MGNVITGGSTTGTVERLTIRSVSLRDVRSTRHIISFSSVEMATKLMRDFSYHVSDIGIAYREDVEDARVTMFEAFENLRGDPCISADHGLLDAELQDHGHRASGFADGCLPAQAEGKDLVRSNKVHNSPTWTGRRS